MKEFFIENFRDYQRRYNVAPSQQIPVVRKEKELCYLKWGLIPSWAKDRSIGNRMINARAETVLEKPSYKNAFKKRRCLVPAVGFYEWQKVGTKKQPFYIHLKDHRPFAFAGLWDRWQSPEGEIIESVTILTTSANDLVSKVHDRMPVIIDKNNYSLWLNCDDDKIEDVKKLLCSYPADQMETYAVSTHVNKPTNEDQKCIEKLTA